MTGGKMALIGFARVSSVQQDLTEQIKTLENFGCEKILYGKNSGKSETNEERIKELLAEAKQGDTVVVTKLDRLGRSLNQVLFVLDKLEKSGIYFKTIQQPIDTSEDNSPLAKAMVQLLGIFAELERSFIVERTKEGRESKGKFGGRPNALSGRKFKNFADDVKAGLSISLLSGKYGIAKSTVVKYRNQIRSEK